MQSSCIFMIAEAFHAYNFFLSAHTFIRIRVSKADGVAHSLAPAPYQKNN